MTGRPVKIPGPDHPISMEAADTTWRVIFNGEIIAESDDVVLMRETTYRVVAYFPRKHVRMDKLRATQHRTYCPYKGEASYFSIEANGHKAENAVWSYEKPFAAVEDISERLAFYPDSVDSIAES